MAQDQVNDDTIDDDELEDIAGGGTASVKDLEVFNGEYHVKIKIDGDWTSYAFGTDLVGSDLTGTLIGYGAGEKKAERISAFISKKIEASGQ